MFHQYAVSFTNLVHGSRDLSNKHLDGVRVGSLHLHLSLHGGGDLAGHQAAGAKNSHGPRGDRSPATALESSSSSSGVHLFTGTADLVSL